MRGARIAYSPAEMVWLEANRMMVISDYHAAFVAAFARTDIGAQHLHGLRKRLGWKVGRAKGRTAGRHWKFSPAEIAWLKANCTLPISDYQAAFSAAFGRADISTQNLNGLRKRMGWKTGRTGRYAKGATPANKGKAMPFHPNSAATRFQKGQRTGRANDLYQPIGTERHHPDGYVERKVNDDLPMQNRWKFVHRIRWEEVHGPIPDGYVLKCLNDDKSNTDPTNWTLVSRGVLSRLNGGRNRKRLAFNDASAEVRPALLTLAKVEQRAHELRRGKAKA